MKKRHFFDSLPIIDGEYWYGAKVHPGPDQPWSAKSKVDLPLVGDTHANQAAPFLVSTRGRYIWSDEPFNMRFDNGVIEISDPYADVEISQGHENLRGAYLAACKKHFSPSGRIPHPLNFSSPQYNAWIQFTRWPTQEKILSYAKTILDNGWPAGVLMIDDFWYMSNGDWRFDPYAFPDPRGMSDKLHEMGFKLILWMSPFITADTVRYHDARQKGLLLEKTDGEPDFHRWWNGYSALLDLSDPKAARWLTDQLDTLKNDFHVDGFKFDAGDAYYYSFEQQAHKALTPNGHTENFARIGLGYDISEYRACWKMGGTHLIQRVRDKDHAWGPGGLADIIPSGLIQGLLGHAFTCPDMVGGGNEGSWSKNRKDPELFIRWAQASIFWPIIQFSRLPSDMLDGKELSIIHDLIALRQKFAPHILELARHASKTGEPVIRHMDYMFPGQGMEPVTDQFMLGDDMLVAPILAKGATGRMVRFPAGEWKGDDGSVVKGPCETKINVPIERIPYYTKTG